MKKEKVAILGTGSHGIVIADALLAENKYEINGFYEKNALFQNCTKQSVMVTKNSEVPIFPESYLFDHLHKISQLIILGLGLNLINIRQKLADRLLKEQYHFCNAIHPSAVISPSADLGYGIAIFAGSVINPFAEIGNHVVVNTGATIDHHCIIGDNSFIQPGAHLAGEVTVGNNTIIGIGASVKNGIKIGSNSIIGGGAFVNNDVPDNVVYAGVPAKKIK